MKHIKKYLTTALFLIGCNCSPAVLESKEVEVDSDSSAVEQEEFAWATWETCSQKPGDHPCDFTLQDQNSNEVQLYEQYGKVILLDFSTMWCGVCNNIAQTGETMVSDYGAEQFVWLTILVENTHGDNPTTEDLQRWAELYGLSHPVLGADRSIIDLSAEDGYPISAWPTIVVIDREMTLYNGINGWNETVVRSWVESLL